MSQIINKSCFWLKQLYPNTRGTNQRIFQVGLIFSDLPNDVIKDDSYFISAFVFNRTKINDIFVEDETLGHIHLFNNQNKIIHNHGFYAINTINRCIILDAAPNPLYIDNKNWRNEWLYIAYI